MATKDISKRSVIDARYGRSIKGKFSRKANTELLIKRRKVWLQEYKYNKSCQMCGWKEHPEILQFHHIKDKSFTIASKKYKYKIETLLKEIEKCILICPNCHMWHHYQERDGKSKL